ncbi:HNH endonuclease [Bacillus cereus]|uniref:Cytoplasmic protein n=3 Tax=Bacillus cereus group TaxID=86661 RepID=A0A9X0FBM6_BACTU|nr:MULTISPECIES: HNH endonuclease [Bacillus cereus group]KIU75726.1 cytoplasmic protein [Bacillus thuringiensis Sbt003]MEB8734335.1 HNH endonuclease [Bacillus cereus]MEB8752670.1 HNH endonuclease [Bacillus cereus]MEB8762956.1 HNH endonuclease [Bacillus cereus]
MVQSLKENNTLKNTLDAMKNTPIPVAVRTVDTGIGMKLPYIESSTVGEVAGKFSKASTAAKDDAYQLAKGTVKNPEIVKFTEEQLSTKPLYSRNPEKWQKKGGEIEISEEGIWTYIDWEIPPNRVSYPGGFPNFKSAGLVRQEVPIGEFNRYDIDFAKADELASNGTKLDENTWHHHQDLTTMQEVSKEMHRRFRHMGGMSLAKKLKD